MDLPTFEKACHALASFPDESPPDRKGRRKVVGLIGGEPLMHPEFGELAAIMRSVIREVSHRGLWTGLDWPNTKHADTVRLLLGSRPSTTVRPVPRGTTGYLNWNQHDRPCFHQPVLVAIQDVVLDEAAIWKLIDACPVQREWSATITPKGFFFCEVAGALDMIFEGPGGLPITPGCWAHDLADYRDQIERWCPRCGMALPLRGRRDTECVDDISPSNLEALEVLRSPRVLAGEYRLFDAARWEPPEHWRPLRYLREKS